MAPQAARYLDLALLGRNEWWRYALGALVIAFSWMVLGYVPLFLLPPSLFVPPFDFIAVNFTIFMMLAGLAFVVKLIHRRPLRSLNSPEQRVDWRRIARAAAAWAALMVAAVVLEHVLFPERYYFSFNPERFFLYLALVLLLTPLQCLAEELVFRGYVMQGLGLIVRRPLAIAVLSSAVFTAPHLLNPEVQEHGAVIMAANYFAIGMLLATVTLRDGRLELAIGLHAANNVLLALVANYEGSALMTESIFTARELDPVYSLATLVVAAVAFHWWIFRRAVE
jgi:membrane protease YdiL (CAAX protease family)